MRPYLRLIFDLVNYKINKLNIKALASSTENHAIITSMFYHTRKLTQTTMIASNS